MAIKKSDILSDMHTHSIFSVHAYSTIGENLEIAKKQGLKYMAVTDHYLCNGDEISKKNEVNRIVYVGERINAFSEENKVKVIPSAEFNIGQEIYNYKGIDNLPWRPIGLHSWFIDIPSLTLDTLYEEYVKLVNRNFHAFVHIERELHKVVKGKYTNKIIEDEAVLEYLKRIVDLAYDNDIWLEVNESTLIVNDGGAAERLYWWLKYAKEKGSKIYLGSDAHYCREVGEFTNVLSLLNSLNYPKELILNCDSEKLDSMFYYV